MDSPTSAEHFRGLPLKAAASLHVTLRDQGQLKGEQRKKKQTRGMCALRERLASFCRPQGSVPLGSLILRGTEYLSWTASVASPLGGLGQVTVLLCASVSPPAKGLSCED